MPAPAPHAISFRTTPPTACSKPRRRGNAKPIPTFVAPPFGLEGARVRARAPGAARHADHDDAAAAHAVDDVPAPAQGTPAARDPPADPQPARAGALHRARHEDHP